MIGSIIGGIICIIGGLWLFLVNGMGPESLAGPLSKGISFYCIGKGVYIIFQGMQLHKIKNLIERDNKVWSSFLETLRENAKIGAVVERIYQRYSIASSGRSN